MARSSTLDGDPIDPEVRNFFRAIKENPEDDSPRLIFADWLQERGDAAASARGEFLRLNVLRHRLSPDDPSYDVLKRREAEIVTQHQWTWLGPLADAARWTYERGMMQLTARAERILTREIANWSRTEAALWIDDLTLTNVVVAVGHHFDLARSPLMEHLNRLDLSDNHLRHHVCALVGAQRLPFLTKLILARNNLTAHHLPSLARCVHSRHLTLLDLRYNRLDDTAAHLLADPLHLKHVAELRLGLNRFTSEGIALLRYAFGERVHF